jgi:hypothetical protein
MNIDLNLPARRRRQQRAAAKRRAIRQAAVVLAVMIPGAAVGARKLATRHAH